jgi:hypothetical protein
VRLGDVQRRYLAQSHRKQRRQVLPRHLRLGAAMAAVLDLQDRHRVQVNDGVQAGDVASVRVAHDE